MYYLFVKNSAIWISSCDRRDSDCSKENQAVIGGINWMKKGKGFTFNETVIIGGLLWKDLEK